MISSRFFSLALTLALMAPEAAFAQTAVPAGLTRIGAAGAVFGKVQAKSPQAGAIGRIVGSGQPLYLNDTITTDAQGRLQVLLLDETIFTIGPNSSMILDKFIYDPTSGEGKLSAKILKGVFRFITGRIARRKPSDMEVRMPVGVIGIRGTMVAGSVGEDGSSTVVLLGPGAGNNAGERVGQVQVTGNGSSAWLLQPGSAVNVGANGALGHIFQISQQQLGGILGPLAASQGTHTSNPTGNVQLPGTATTLSGQTLAIGLNNAIGNTNATTNFQAASGLLNTINGSQLVDGPSTWDQVRTLSFGVATYVGTAPVTQNMCGVSPCGPFVGGTLNFTMTVDFGARTINGGGINFLTSQDQGGSVLINPVSFASLTGSATLPSSAITDTRYAGTTITINNASGSVAGTATAHLVYKDNIFGATGTVTGYR